MPSEWVKLIRETDQQKPFNIVYVERPLTDDMKSDDTPVVTVKDYKTAYESVVRPVTGISEFRGVKFCSGKAAMSRIAMTASCETPMPLLKRGRNLSSLTDRRGIRRVYRAGTFLPIKEPKYNDVIQLLQHIHVADEVTFYANLQPDSVNADTDDERE